MVKFRLHRILAFLARVVGAGGGAPVPLAHAVGEVAQQRPRGSGVARQEVLLPRVREHHRPADVAEVLRALRNAQALHPRDRDG